MKQKQCREDGRSTESRETSGQTPLAHLNIRRFVFFQTAFNRVDLLQDEVAVETQFAALASQFILRLLFDGQGGLPVHQASLQRSVSQ